MAEDENEGLRQAWLAFKAGDESIRPLLIEAYLPLVRYQASRQVMGLPGHVDMDDLVQAGTFGLMDALDRYELDRVKFETFALHRIRGAIIDYLRDLDWAPRSLRARLRTIEKFAGDFEHQHGRPPSELELATGVGITAEEVRRTLGRARASTFLSLDATMDSRERSDGASDGGRVELTDTLKAAVDIGLGVEVDEFARVLAAAIPRLTEADRVVLAMYYVEELSLADISGALGVVESRASQLHTRAVANLQRALVGAL